MLAGSMALWLADGEPMHWFPNDADLFAYGTPSDESNGMQMAEKCISCNNLSYSYLCNASNAPDPHEGGPRPLIIHHKSKDGTIQFILSSHFPTPESVLNSFDISCAMVGFTAPKTCIKGPRFASDRFTAYYWPGFLNTTEEHTLVAYQSRRTHSRAQKYKARGYAQAPDGRATHDQMRFAAVYTMTYCRSYRTFLEKNAPVECQCTRRRYPCYFDTVVTGSMLPPLAADAHSYAPP